MKVKDEGIFEWLVIDDRPGFVHIWSHSDQKTIRTGERVKPQQVLVEGSETFSVEVKQGGYVNVLKNRLTNFSDTPTFKIIVDRFGHPVSQPVTIK